MGRPDNVTPFLRHAAAAEEDSLADNTVAVFEWGGALGVLSTAAMEGGAFPRRRFEVIGSEGSIVLEPLEPPAVRLYLRRASEGYAAGWQFVPVENIPRYVRDLEELARAVRGEQAFPYSPEHDRVVQETVLRASGMLGG
jgi:predicted dehydrogenase